MKDIAVKAARAAGKIILDNFLNLKNIDKKSEQDVVTNTDFECEKEIIRIIKERFPDHSILSEECGEEINNSEYKWIIDPLDGTVNYANGVPIACTSIALMKDEEIILSVIFDPFREELFVAEKGNGAFLNDKPIQVSKKDLLIDCLACFDGIRTDVLDDMLKNIKNLIPNVRKLRYLGSAALHLAYTACGRFDCYFCPSINLWDCAAGIIMIREAGGVVYNFDNINWRNNRGVIASNKIVHDEFVKWLM